MFILSNFSERLSELMQDKGVNAPKLAEEVGCKRNTINRYLEGVFAPSLNAAVKLADYFGCTLDFLLALDDENRAEKFAPCPPFAERVAFMFEHFKKKKSELRDEKKIPESAIYNWLRGETTPSADNVALIAEFFGCTVDFLVGREI